MSFWRQFTHGLRGLLHRNERESEMDAEVQNYFEEAAAAYRERGLSDEDAFQAARREYGSLSAAKEQMRTYGWENTCRTLVADLRFAVRQLRRNLGFTTVSILTLGLGIGASTTIFSAVNPILFKPLPYPHSGRILTVWGTLLGSRFEIAYGTYQELRQRSRSFDSTAIYEPWQPTMTGHAEPERLEGQSVSSEFLNVLGVAPQKGRDFVATDEGPHAAKTVILSDALWRRLFNADPATIGRTVQLDGDNYTVIGIMPRGFDDVLSPSAELWTPVDYDASRLTQEFNTWAWGNHLRMIGRMRPGVSRENAVRELAAIARTPWPQFPRPRGAALRRGLIVDSLQDDIAHTVKPALLAVFGAVIVVLAIASVNVINLLLARSSQRAGEFAVRGAMGASRWRILRQLVTESMVLTFLGGALGVVTAIAGVRLIVALSPAQLPRLNAIHFDTAAFLFACALVTLIGLAAGTVPALHIARNDLQADLQSASRRIAGTHKWTRRSLVVAEIALALVLLVSAGLLLRSMQRLIAVDPGFNSAQLQTMQVVTSGHQFDMSPANPDGDERRREFFERSLDAVRRVPGVESAAFTTLLPLSDDPPVVGQYGAQFDDQDDAASGYNVFRYAVSPGYCQTMGIRLISGRLLDERDRTNAPHTALISQSLARQHFGSRNPIGSRLHVGPRDRPWYTVVGLVGDVKQTSLSIDDADAVYLSTRQTWFADDTLSFVIRGQGDVAALVPAIKAAIWSVNKDQPIVRIVTMDRMMAISEAERRFILILFEAFGIVALLLAAIGLYGVLAGNVAERIHEIGIRMALGASRSNILAMALLDGMRLTAFGLGIGLCGALASSKGIASLLFGTSELDPISWFGMSMLLAAVAVLACWIPAWRGTRVDPASTLRSE
jgi:putative ABC transport system permease protein